MILELQNAVFNAHAALWTLLVTRMADAPMHLIPHGHAGSLFLSLCSIYVDLVSGQTRMPMEAGTSEHWVPVS